VRAPEVRRVARHGHAQERGFEWHGPRAVLAVRRMDVTTAPAPRTGCSGRHRATLSPRYRMMAAAPEGAASAKASPAQATAVTTFRMATFCVSMRTHGVIPARLAQRAGS